MEASRDVILVLLLSGFRGGEICTKEGQAQFRATSSADGGGKKRPVRERAVGAGVMYSTGRARASMTVEGFEGFSSADALCANPCNASSGPVGSR